MSTVVPRLFGDVAEWLDREIPLGRRAIRVEDLVTEHEYKLRAELPGLDPVKDIEVHVHRGELSIHAERRDTEHTRHRTEFRYGVLRRAVRLPATADTEHATASYAHGILTVTVPLTEPG